MMNENRIVLVAEPVKLSNGCRGCVFEASKDRCTVGEDFHLPNCVSLAREDGRNIIWVIEPEQSRLTDEQKSNIESKFSEVA